MEQTVRYSIWIYLLYNFFFKFTFPASAAGWKLYTGFFFMLPSGTNPVSLKLLFLHSLTTAVVETGCWYMCFRNYLHNKGCSGGVKLSWGRNTTIHAALNEPGGSVWYVAPLATFLSAWWRRDGVPAFLILCNIASPCNLPWFRQADGDLPAVIAMWTLTRRDWALMQIVSNFKCLLIKFSIV